MSNTSSISEVKTPRQLGVSNKEINVGKIKGINIKKFRNMNQKYLELSDRITVVSGHNGTMKSTLIGLFVQPFNSDSTDLYGNPLKTNFSNIFKLSPTYDKEKYEYDILIEDDEGLDIKIPIYTKPRSKDNPKIRIVTGGNTSNDGNLLYDTNYLNLNRLFSIHTSDATPTRVYISDWEKKFVSDFYKSILLKGSYNNMETVYDNKQIKQTFGPTKGNYDYEAISSGEDNLGRIAHSLISFMRLKELNKNQRSFNGIMCIDEIEASLHPVAQINLFNFLYKWAKRYKVQILVNTHSLSLIKHAIEEQEKQKEVNTYYLSTLYSDEIEVIEKPLYEKIYKELTFDFNVNSNIAPKIDILCEDKLAKKFMRFMISKQHIIKRINFIEHDEGEGLPFNFLVKLCNSASSFLTNTIVVFDADVSDKSIDKIKNQDQVMRLPDESLELPIEKLFIKFLFDSNKDDSIFTSTLRKPKDLFIKTLIDQNIKLETSDDLKNTDSKKVKKWFENNPEIVNKLFNKFSKSVNGRERFVNELITKMNKINAIHGYPPIVK
ncbi:hypothetical protein N780_01890 [Pontibacillus chungwhensis BH030062]|uniref:Endonuclease GajA/Old nuclease/RecF-like AAA domain-containing protein n=1 Tax=Pontibacillus chungwhensis BH030062 TaxID=1385513 RepID=A0A0A2V0U0_9BACI|nr:AAA family ATPase [Pontibacillus chungwhensis]KGP92396.1 hypothetical protein N780_01890 [Pontibacillus chungwhensis BH030062]